MDELHTKRRCSSPMSLLGLATQRRGSATVWGSDPVAAPVIFRSLLAPLTRRQADCRDQPLSPTAGSCRFCTTVSPAAGLGPTTWRACPATSTATSSSCCELEGRGAAGGIAAAADRPMRACAFPAVQRPPPDRTAATMGSKACVSRLQKEYKAILKASSGAWGMRRPAVHRRTSGVVADVVARVLSPHHCAGASATDYCAPGTQQPAGVALVRGRKRWHVVCYMRWLQ